MMKNQKRFVPMSLAQGSPKVLDTIFLDGDALTKIVLGMYSRCLEMGTVKLTAWKAWIPVHTDWHAKVNDMR